MENNSQDKKRTGLFDVVQIQFAVFIYSIVSVLSKISSTRLKNFGVISIQFIFSIGLMLFVLMVYAVVWQKILKKMDLYVAYLNKGFSLFWSSIWAILLFSEKINMYNIAGIIVIILGIVLVGGNE